MTDKLREGGGFDSGSFHIQPSPTRDQFYMRVENGLGKERQADAKTAGQRHRHGGRKNDWAEAELS